LVSLEDRPAVRLAHPVVCIGRHPQADVFVRDDRVSRQHAELRCAKGVWRLVDVGSRNGTFLNGERVREAELVNGDRIVFAEDGPAFVFARFPHDDNN